MNNANNNVAEIDAADDSWVQAVEVREAASTATAYWQIELSISLIDCKPQKESDISDLLEYAKNGTVSLNKSVTDEVMNIDQNVLVKLSIHAANPKPLTVC